MRERAENLGGSFHVDSEPGAGTTIGLQASERIEVNARVDGFLEEFAFVEGSTVQERATLGIKHSL